MSFYKFHGTVRPFFLRSTFQVISEDIFVTVTSIMAENDTSRFPDEDSRGHAHRSPSVRHCKALSFTLFK